MIRIQLFKRNSKKHGVIYHVRFFDENGDVIATRSTNQHKKSEAKKEAERILSSGEVLIKRIENPLLIDFMKEFWDENSTYIKLKKAENHPISVRYIADAKRTIKKWIEEFSEFKHLKISEINPLVVKNWIAWLIEKKVPPRSINISLQYLHVAVRSWFEDRSLIDPLFKKIKKVYENTRKRGVLTFDEILKLEKVKPDDTLDIRAWGAVRIALYCGLRLGEIRGLFFSDVENLKKGHPLKVVRNYIEKEGLKAPKWNSQRETIFPLQARETVEALKISCPYKKGRKFLFYSASLKSPVSGHTITKGFKIMLEKIGIGKEEQKTRYLTFHGLRHAFVTRWRSSGIGDYVVMRWAGHRSTEMTDLYSQNTLIDYSEAENRFISQEIG